MRYPKAKDLEPISMKEKKKEWRKEEKNCSTQDSTDRKSIYYRSLVLPITFAEFAQLVFLKQIGKG
jgi:hypothetical protein